MKQDRIAEVNIDLDYAQHNLSTLIALFGYKDNSMIFANKDRAISMADCVINIMTNLKRTLSADDGKGDC